MRRYPCAPEQRSSVNEAWRVLYRLGQTRDGCNVLLHPDNRHVTDLAFFAGAHDALVLVERYGDLRERLQASADLVDVACEKIARIDRAQQALLLGRQIR